MQRVSIRRLVLTTIASILLGLLALCELGLSYPVAWWLYGTVVLLAAAGLLQRAPLRHQVAPLIVVAAVALAVGVCYGIDWTSRKPFLRDVARIRPGLTERDVRKIMGRYLEGTGWPAAPLDLEADAKSAAATGELTLRDALVFRHSTDGRFNSDWGIVRFAEGRVVATEFSAD